jgi:hypothetical protein
MTKISNTDAYPFDTEITGDEYMIGTEPAGSPQNQTKSFKLSDIKNYVLGYSNYVATLTQVDVLAPVATVMNNTIGEITYERNDSGLYSIMSDGLFVSDKTVVFISSTSDTSNVYYSIISDSEIMVDTSKDEEMSKMSIEIRVYN